MYVKLLLVTTTEMATSLITISNYPCSAYYAFQFIQEKANRGIKVDEFDEASSESSPSLYWIGSGRVIDFIVIVVPVHRLRIIDCSRLWSLSCNHTVGVSLRNRVLSTHLISIYFWDLYIYSRFSALSMNVRWGFLWLSKLLFHCLCLAHKVLQNIFVCDMQKEKIKSVRCSSQGDHKIQSIFSGPRKRDVVFCRWILKRLKSTDRFHVLVSSSLRFFHCFV